MLTVITGNSYHEGESYKKTKDAPTFVFSLDSIAKIMSIGLPSRFHEPSVQQMYPMGIDKMMGWSRSRKLEWNGGAIGGEEGTIEFTRHELTE
jgi:hypothetical protein